jgi:antitoxin CptB
MGMDDLAKLQWQCRRGTKELDLMLLHYLQTRYPTASMEEKARFVELLKLDDAELLQRSYGLFTFN